MSLDRMWLAGEGMSKLDDSRTTEKIGIVRGDGIGGSRVVSEMEKQEDVTGLWGSRRKKLMSLAVKQDSRFLA